MYENVGRKLKSMASGIFMLILIVSVVVSIMKFVECGEAYEKADDSSSKYSERAHESEGTMLAVEGVVYLVAGPVLGWMLTCAIYAFGELVEKTSNIERVVYMNDLKSGAGKQTPYKPASVPTRDPFADGIPESLRRLREKGLITDSDLKKIYHYDASQDSVD